MSTATADAASDATTEFRRDELGRPVADDGHPIAGLATIPELIAASGLKRSKIYGMLDNEIPTRKYGRSRRVEWAVIRRMFLDSAES